MSTKFCKAFDGIFSRRESPVYMILFAMFIAMVTPEAHSMVKKISVVATNNEYTILDKNLLSSYSGDISKLKKLKRYIKEKGFPDLHAKSDLNFIIESMKWVTKQWKHNGWNQPPQGYSALDVLKKVHEENAQFRCVEYGLVLTEILQAHGFLARKLAVQSTDVAYGGFGRGHVAAEIWSDELSKWLFFDPQFGVYITDKKGTPLNYYEVYKSQKQGGWKNLRVNSLVIGVSGSKPSEYRKFISDYFGYIKIRIGEDDISLGLDSDKPSLTFQGMPMNLGIFTKDPRLAYSNINKVTMIIDYDYKKPNYRDIFKDLDKVEDKDLPKVFEEKLPQLAAKPLFAVELKNNMPNFSFYEYKFGRRSKWIKLHKQKIKWEALKKENFLSVRGVNKLGRPGPITFIQLSYKK